MFRRDHGRVFAALVRELGDWQLAEDALMDAFAAAAERWPVDGEPDHPRAWLFTTARRRAVDRVRRRRTRVDKAPELDALLRTLGDERAASEPEPPDHLLQLLFTCCHPALAPEARVALTLRTVGGLTTDEIARAFLVSEATMAQRLVRAQRKIAQAGIPYRVPEAAELPERLDGVLSCLYLVFNEGYAATAGQSLLRVDLAEQAIALARQLRERMPDEPEVTALLALMLFHHSRRATRVDPTGRLVLLEDQDRSLWDRAAIEEGLALLGRPLPVGVYALQAWIAANHARAARPEDVRWAEIAALYRVLWGLTGNPVVGLNHAVAAAMADGPEVGLVLLARADLAGPLGGSHLFHAARADLLRRAGRSVEAAEAYRAALDRVVNEAERAFLAERLATVGGAVPKRS